jgi:hypothetical protein
MVIYKREGGSLTINSIGPVYRRGQEHADVFAAYGQQPRGSRGTWVLETLALGMRANASVPDARPQRDASETKRLAAAVADELEARGLVMAADGGQGETSGEGDAADVYGGMFDEL